MAYDYITLTAHYGYNASIAPIPAGPIKRTALQIADLYLRDKLPQSNSINLCAYVLLALAGLPENGDWRSVGSLREMSNAEIIDCMAATQSMRPSRGKATVRNNAINALLDAGVIARKGDPAFSSELRNIKYFITPQTLAALQQLTTNGAW